ncbi:hypothetical protein BJ170DRAFT_683764 [Xylariales sp. AK1849]|nr:hypothetical protein BJ170DRAFT_683764 [Xylariales sp. AK1849]
MVSDDDLTNLHHLFSLYFDNDMEHRFSFEKNVGSGTEAMAWRIKYSPTPGVTKRIVLKHDKYISNFDTNYVPMQVDGADDEQPAQESPILIERKWLDILKWAKHIVGIEDIPDDPLLRRLPLRSHHMEHWNFLEWVENGTVGDFIQRMLDHDIQVLPNRLLWRFFLCLIRTCIAMAWPPQPAADGLPLLEHVGLQKPRGILHGDIHSGNVMIGAFEAPPGEVEHDIAPPLKLIDFSSAWEVSSESSSDDTTKINVFDMGTIMVELATLSPDAGLPLSAEDSEVVYVQERRDSPRIKTVGLALLPDADGKDPVPNLDKDLRFLICACLAVDYQHRPGLAALASVAMTAIEERNAEWYLDPFRGHRNPHLEGDGYVKDILTRCILDG